MTATARQLTKAVVSETQRSPYGTCAYCGARCFGFACRAHDDLPQLERSAYSQSNEPDRTHARDAQPDSQPEGV